MAINSLETQGDKKSSKHVSNYSKGPSCHMLKLSITTDGSVTSSDGKSSKVLRNFNGKSPYLVGDSVQLLSRVTEKKLYAHHKKATDYRSSFPLAATIYRANSDEFKSQKKGNKKVKKSVLTLPNEPTSIPQTCTVSDTNDSKYAERTDDSRNLKQNKRSQNRKSRVRNKNYEFYDRDARYCSQMNISLDCSSTDMINQFTGDSKRVTGRFRTGKELPDERKLNAHDVWAVLRNINRFQFRPSPPMSEDSIPSVKKKKIRNKRKNNRKDTRVIETCRTEEFAYISSYDVDSKSPISFSQSSSFDRITVIDKQDEFSKICEKFEKNIIKTKNTNQRKNKSQGRKNTKNNSPKPISYRENNNQLETKNSVLRDSTPINQSLNNIDNPETLVAEALNPKKKCTSNLIQVAKPTDLKGILNQPKLSNGTLHSGSSKAAVNTSTNLIEDCHDKLLLVPPNEFSRPVKGITKVVLCNGQNKILPDRINDTQNKKLQLETLPRATIIPKLTQTEIKRQLANMKFPIVILGKDQLCSTSMRVMSNDPPHLQGLDQQIWPFMQDWHNTVTCENINESKNHTRVNEKSNEYVQISKMKHRNVDKNGRKQNETIAFKTGGKEKILNEDIPQNKKKSFKRPVPPIETSKNKPQATKKSKPMLQLKDKMLKLLYKNTSAKDVDDQCKISNNDSNSTCIRSIEVKPENINNKVDVGIETCMEYELVSQNLSKPPNLCSLLEINKMPIIAKQPWAKAKWASDFIETVIKRIRSGVYYNQENKHHNTDVKDVSVQTILIGKNFNLNEAVIKDDVLENTSNVFCPSIIQHEINHSLVALPGFDETLPALEIQTLNMKEVAVKHCNTNVLVQFDIAVPPVTEELQSLPKPPTFVPLTVTESQTKIFKCKTTIVNAMLPAEICSLLPKIMLSIMNSKKLPPLSSSVPYQSESLLYTISELSNSESQDLLKPVLPPGQNVAPKLLALLDGAYIKKRDKVYKCPELHYNETVYILPKINTRQLISYYGHPHSVYLCGGRKHVEVPQYFNDLENKCTTLALYTGNKESGTLNSVFGQRNSNETGKVFNLNINMIPIQFSFDDNRILVKMTKQNCGFDEVTSITISDINIQSLYKEFQDHLSKYRLNNNNVNALEYNKKHFNKFYKQCGQNTNLTSNLKVRKNKFVKLYKKCKSTSNISGEKNSTLLSKIANIDDFLQALGTGKILSSVFDGFSEKKIISAIFEMKNWITEISQRQAMLILLLTNKKETPNLVRFRPILLQAIAVNRITRASELDMEIEVIETENFHKFSKYEGIPYVMESVENQDILMEELYWIAKTTASDYQKPFNEDSEKLLKSLLEKRKKLNPSYLRVMARYVGLGLLKSTNKN